MRLRQTEFAQAAIALDSPGWKIIFLHIISNVPHLILITVMLRFSSEVLFEAVLTYLGIGFGADTRS
jgi:peptide/nickel transport system permease protein